jgi:hypothetical protein
LERNASRYTTENDYFRNVIDMMFGVEELKELSDGRQTVLLRKKPNPEEMELLGLEMVG